MTALDHTPDVLDREELIAEAALDAGHGFRTLRTTGTLPDGGTISLITRVPAERVGLVFVDGPEGTVGPFERSLSGGAAPAAIGDDTHGLERVLDAHPELTTIAYVRSPHLVAWAQTGKDLPIRYVPVQRWTLARVLPARPADRSLVDFIEQALIADPHTPAVLDTGEGAVVWGPKGILGTLEYLQLVEEGAQLQILAQALGGSKPVGPGVLVQQWRMSGLEDQAREAGLLD